MRAWLVAALLLAGLVAATDSASAQPSPCDGILSCHIENAPPNCGTGWYGSEDVYVGPVWITVNYCKYEGPPQ